MNILILGAGRVGFSLAQHLNKDKTCNITIIDYNRTKLNRLQEAFDIRVVLGESAHPTTLLEADVKNNDLLIAVSRYDETNLLACQIAHQLNPDLKTICRVHADTYWKNRKLLDTDCVGNVIINSFISPQRLISRFIERLIETPGALQTMNFAKGLLRLIVVRAHKGGPLVDTRILEIKNHLSDNVDARIVAIYRGDKSIPPDGNTIIQQDDEVFFIAATEHIMTIMNELRRTERPYKKIAIAGAGRIGFRLAKALENKVSSVKLIDTDLTKIKDANMQLDKTITLHGNAADPTLLIQEHINQSDVFIALTGNDQANILSSMLAKFYNAHKVMALVNRPEFVPLLENSQIDVVISRDQITISSILAYIRQESAKTAIAHSLRRGAAEALEIELQEDSTINNKRLDQVDIPLGITVGAIVRQKRCIIAHSHTVFEAHDHVIIFIHSQDKLNHIEKIFGSHITKTRNNHHK